MARKDLKIQLKGRLTFEQQYLNKNLWIALRNAESWYLYEHDVLLERVRKRIQNSAAWREQGAYSLASSAALGRPTCRCIASSLSQDQPR